MTILDEIDAAHTMPPADRVELRDERDRARTPCRSRSPACRARIPITTSSGVSGAWAGSVVSMNMSGFGAEFGSSRFPPSC
jgi:hypothetical protein